MPICESTAQKGIGIFMRNDGRHRKRNCYRSGLLRSELSCECADCDNLQHCAVDKGSIRINAGSHYGAMYRNRERCLTDEYKYRKKLRSIWSEGTFAVLKREHKLKRAEKRGIHRVHEECLLSALALNLKRMIKALSGNSEQYFRIILICIRH